MVVLSVTSSDAAQVHLPVQQVSINKESAAPAEAEPLDLVHGLYGRPSIVSRRSAPCTRKTAPF